MRAWLRGLWFAAAAMWLGCGPPGAPPDAADAGPDVGVDACVAPGYPSGPYDIAVDATLPDLHFAGADGGGEVTLGRFYEPCAARSRLLVVRTFAAWSGPSGWWVAHTGALRQRPDAARL